MSENGGFWYNGLDDNHDSVSEFDEVGGLNKAPKAEEPTSTEKLATLLSQQQELVQTIATLKGENETLSGKNSKQYELLKEARQQLLALREEVARLATPPNDYGVLLATYDDNSVDISMQGRKLRVVCSPSIDVRTLRVGQTVRLNEALTIVDVANFTRIGELCILKELLERDPEDAEPYRVRIANQTGEERVAMVADSIDPSLLKEGDALLFNSKEGLVYERVPTSNSETLILEEVPDISYEDVGGLTKQIEQIRDAVELPYLYADLFKEFELRAPKGILLYGPPGCGKTLIAKAVANSLAKKVKERTGSGNGKAFFINIKGPELLNKWVGETERHIREIFLQARLKASEGMPVVVFFDEMESLFHTRGTGVSSDMEKTVVPQLLTELDGVEGLTNVIVIGASNREDLIDPAVLRPGRLDVKIKVERPDAEAASDIFSKYLTTSLPIHPDDLAYWGNDREACIKAMIEQTVTRMYANEDKNRFLEVTYENGEKEILYFKDFNSGAMTENIVSRAKKRAVKDVIEGQQRGIRIQHLMDAIAEEFAQNEDLPNTTNPDDWARISGKRGKRIVYIRTFIKEHKEGSSSKPTTTPSSAMPGTGQYL